MRDCETRGEGEYGMKDEHVDDGESQLLVWHRWPQETPRAEE